MTKRRSGLGPHVDSMPAELLGFVYLDDVPPRSGGTTIWPTSPQQLWPCLEVEQSCGFIPNNEWTSTVARILQTVSPVEFVGSAGDVLFLHPLMLHSAGVNSAVHGSGTIRMAAVMEWQLHRPPLTPGDEANRILWWTLTDSSRAVERGPHDMPEYNTRVRPDGTFPAAIDGRAPEEEAEAEVELVWHHDAAEYMPQPVEPKPADIWQRWRFTEVSIEPMDCNVVDEQPWWERHKLQSPTSCTAKLKDIATLDTEAGVWRLDSASAL